MADQNDDILRAYLEEVMRVQREGHRSLSQDDLDAVARDLGMSDEDMRVIRRRHDDSVQRAQGFLRYNNWGGAIDELKQAVTLSPTSANTHALLASAYRGRYGESRSEDDLNAALGSARRALALEPRNELALSVASEMQRRSTPLSPTQRFRRIGLALALVAVLVGVGYLISSSGSSKSAGEDEADRIRARAESTAAAVRKRVEQNGSTPEEPVKAAVPMEPDTGFLHPLGVFGSEGIGEGMLKDARSIAVAGDSTVLVADYSSGRIQRFAPDGRFLNGWNIGENRYVQGMVANRAGTVYVVAAGEIERYEAATGRSLGQLKAPSGRGFAAVALAPGGKIVALWSGYAARSGMFVNAKPDDAIITFNESGRVLSTWKNALGKAGGGVLFNGSIAVDGLGAIYAGARSYLFRFSPDGTFDDRIKLPSDKFVIDGQGRIIVASGPSFSLLDREGVTLTTWSLDRKDEQYKGLYTIDGLALSPSGDLYGVARTRVLRLRPRQN